MRKPAAVLISDVHYRLDTLSLADAAMRQAIDKANNLGVPLIVCGDLHDTKANLRGECVNAMVETFKLCRQKPYILIGNHDKINEKSDDHSLNFLASLDVELVTKPTTLPNSNFALMIPYQHDLEVAKRVVNYGKNYKAVIIHQGLQGSNTGDYFQDPTALKPEDVAGLRVISGHYHARQTIELPNGGVWDFVGNPYTLTYGEANDPEKGFQILYNDGSLEFVPTKLRKHVIIELDADFNVLNKVYMPRLNDLLWVKVYDTHEKLQSVNRQKVKEWLLVIDTFKLDLIPTEAKSELNQTINALNSAELMDELIDSLTNTSDERKTKLKELWRHLGS